MNDYPPAGWRYIAEELLARLDFETGGKRDGSRFENMIDGASPTQPGEPHYRGRFWRRNIPKALCSRCGNLCYAGTHAISLFVLNDRAGTADVSDEFSVCVTIKHFVGGEERPFHLCDECRGWLRENAQVKW